MKLLIVDDHSVVRAGLRRLLASFLDAEIIEAGCAREALAQVREDKPDLVVLDINLPGTGGLDLMRRMLAEEPKTRVLVFSVHAAPVYVMRAMQTGAFGYVSKSASAEELLEAVRQVADGRRYVERELAAELATNMFSGGNGGAAMSNRELDIMRLMAQGMGLSDIATSLGVSYKTIANACTTLKQKLMVERTADLIRLAVEMHVDQKPVQVEK